MKYILIIFISIFTLNYSFSQMEVYRGQDASLSAHKSKNLVGIIYESGEVYKISNGSEELIGEVINNKFYMFSKYIGRCGDVSTMGNGGKIYTGKRPNEDMVGLIEYGKYYVSRNIDDHSYMIGFHSNAWQTKAGDGKYAAAYFLLLFNQK